MPINEATHDLTLQPEASNAEVIPGYCLLETGVAILFHLITSLI